MTPDEWESICDGCGKCCLVKLEDEDSGELACTSVSCKLLDTDTVRCKDYSNRNNIVKECILLTPESINQYPWLPPTCAYVLLNNGQDLPYWHPLVSGDINSTHKEQMSIQNKCISIEDIDEDNIVEYVTHFIVDDDTL